jgi:hypothetical protein
VLPEDTQSIAVKVVSGNGQSAPPGEELPQPIVIKVTDADSNPLPDVRMAFVLGAGAEGGATTPDTTLTDEAGEASTRWVLGDGLGEQEVHAEVVGAGLDGVSFTATAVEDLPQPSAEHSSVTASPESIEVVTGLSVIGVTVRDGRGDPIAGATVTLAASGVGNVLTQPSGPTDEEGVAEGTLQAITPETKVISAVVNGSVTLAQTAQVVVTQPQAQADHLVFRVQPNDTERDQIITPPVEVAIVDAAGEVVPLSGVEIEIEFLRDGEREHQFDGDPTRDTVDGIAVFPDLSEDHDHDGFQIRATAPDMPELGSVLSSPFDIED